MAANEGEQVFMALVGQCSRHALDVRYDERTALVVVSLPKAPLMALRLLFLVKYVNRTLQCTMVTVRHPDRIQQATNCFEDIGKAVAAMDNIFTKRDEAEARLSLSRSCTD